jgi:hypothetical protein
MRQRIVPGLLVALLALAGCGGGGEQVIRVISADELPVACVAKPKPGYCSGSIYKFYYDYRDNRCKTFYWSGCGGHVPYQTMTECLKQCEGRN